MKCICGRDNRVDARFCDSCGAKLSVSWRCNNAPSAREPAVRPRPHATVWATRRTARRKTTMQTVIVLKTWASTIPSTLKLLRTPARRLRRHAAAVARGPAASSTWVEAERVRTLTVEPRLSESAIFDALDPVVPVHREENLLKAVRRPAVPGGVDAHRRGLPGAGRPSTIPARARLLLRDSTACCRRRSSDPPSFRIVTHLVEMLAASRIDHPDALRRDLVGRLVVESISHRGTTRPMPGTRCWRTPRSVRYLVPGWRRCIGKIHTAPVRRRPAIAAAADCSRTLSAKPADQTAIDMEAGWRCSDRAYQEALRHFDRGLKLLPSFEMKLRDSATK